MAWRSKLEQTKATRFIGAAAVILGVMFAVAFGGKVLEAIRLRNWRERLQSEVQQLERQQADWRAQYERMSSPAWREKELRDAGWKKEDVVVLQVVTATPQATDIPATPEAEAQPPALTAPVMRWFDNPNWHAWRRLLGGFD
ncbi:MAG: hypothetical protein GXY52_04735 [Chloroflexi bacterium]|nr:hypothetical protein [Chloroflexota bacterium]